MEPTNLTEDKESTVDINGFVEGTPGPEEAKPGVEIEKPVEVSEPEPKEELKEEEPLKEEPVTSVTEDETPDEEIPDTPEDPFADLSLSPEQRKIVEKQMGPKARELFIAQARESREHARSKEELAKENVQLKERVTFENPDGWILDPKYQELALKESNQSEKVRLLYSQLVLANEGKPFRTIVEKDGKLYWSQGEFEANGENVVSLQSMLADERDELREAKSAANAFKKDYSTRVSKVTSNIKSIMDKVTPNWDETTKGDEVIAKSYAANLEKLREQGLSEALNPTAPLIARLYTLVQAFASQLNRQAKQDGAKAKNAKIAEVRGPIGKKNGVANTGSRMVDVSSFVSDD